jgi:alpha-amylase/alpha-mannosidase (GH57 family)
MRRLLPVLASLPLLLPGIPAVAAPASEPLHVAVVWHQHQPQYPKVPGTNVYEQPWVRLHAAKDYVDMAEMVREFPGLKLTINLTPVLLNQVEDLNRGATDRHAQLAAKDAGTLTPAEKTEAYRRFFQVSGPMLAAWPRLAELKARPLATYAAQDFRDLATLFHLAWTDTMFFEDDELAAIARKGRGYTEADKAHVLATHRVALSRIVPLHKELQDEGRLEVTTTPYFHPILPLIHDSELAKEAMPGTPMPTKRFSYPEDAKFHVTAAVEHYKRLFGRAPRGMWPGEGSVAQAVAPLFKQAGIRWIATDEEVLARSLKTPLRQGETMTRPDVLYKPYQVANGPAIVFRDRKLSDDIGFRYSKMTGEAAAKDLLGQLKAIAAKPAQGPRLVSIILDGENAWENYTDDGKAFLRALYRGLSTDPALRTTTPSEYLASHTPTPLPRLWAGSWIAGSFSTWIGEDEENQAWDLLTDARHAVAAYGKAKGTNDARYQKALQTLYAAEGSDWFWWYGRDQDSGRDEEFDKAFRDLLASAYTQIGAKAPTILAVPIIQAGVTPTREPKGYWAPTIDGQLQRHELLNAGSVFAEGGAMAVGNQPIGTLYYGWDKQRLNLAVQFNGPARPFTLYMGQPAGTGKAVAGVPFLVKRSYRVDPAKNMITPLDAPGEWLQAAGGNEAAEVAIPWAAIGATGGDSWLLAVVPQGGAAFPNPPLRIQAPLVPVKSQVILKDGEDDRRYALPKSGAFTRDSVDLKGLTVGELGDRWAFTWQLGDVRNPWGSPIGLSLVTLDLYLATSGQTGKPTPLLTGRDAAAARPYTHALSIEGWQQVLYGPTGQKIADVAVSVDPIANEVRATVPKKLLPGNPRRWSYLAVLAGQDGFAPGRVRAVLPAPDADHFGGRPAGRWSNLLDVILPPMLPQSVVLMPDPGERVIVPYVTPEGRVEGLE